MKTTWDPPREGLENNRWNSMGKAFSSFQYATGSCNILFTALPHKIPFILQKALSDGNFFTLDTGLSTASQNYTCIRPECGWPLGPLKSYNSSSYFRQSKAIIKKWDYPSQESIIYWVLGLASQVMVLRNCQPFLFCEPDARIPFWPHTSFLAVKYELLCRLISAPEIRS